MNLRATLLACLIPPLLLACGENTPDPRPQWIVEISTDMPVPQFGDRLLIEVYDASGKIACSGCRRQLGVGTSSAWPLSFGITPSPSGAGLWIRARLYRMLRTDTDGLPEGTMMIDAYVQLPPADTAMNVRLPLDMRCFGVPADLGQKLSCNPTTGTLVPSPTLSMGGTFLREGSWAPAQPTPCKGEVPDDMVCVPGGTFLMGNPVDVVAGHQFMSATTESLVQISPFALDRDEVTVGQVRELLVLGKLNKPPITRSSNPLSRDALCTYVGIDDPSSDGMPVNCVDLAFAQRTCETLGKRLPTEAEWEFVAGNLSAETKFPWGNDASDLCNMAVLSVGRWEIEMAEGEEYTCRATSGSEPKPPGPVAGGSPNDVTELGVRNLAGNVSEWLADGFAPYGTSCWLHGASLRTDPLCPPDGSSTDAQYSLRGSSYAREPYTAAVYSRISAKPSFANPSVGFRCAKSL